MRPILLTTVLSALALAPVSSFASPQGATHQGAQGSEAGGQPAANPQLAKEDRDFFEDAAQGGLLEVKLGELVIKQGASDDAKKFAQRMIDDHTKVNKDLATAAQQLGLIVPAELDKKHKDELDKMAKHSGEKLDREYMSRMVDEHKDDVKAFEKESKDGKNPTLKQFAASNLPTLREHLTLAREIQGRMKK
jgi:putative membrane protein